MKIIKTDKNPIQAGQQLISLAMEEASLIFNFCAGIFN